MARVKVKMRSRKRSERWIYEFKAAEGSRITDTDARRIGPELARIHERDGELRAEAVVDVAKSPRSKLHRYFEWDVQKAAEAHWLTTAGRLIRAIKIEVITAPHAAPKEVRAFVKLDRSVRGYVPMTEVLKRDDYTAMMLARALEEFEVWKKRYENIAEFTTTFRGVSAVLSHAQERLRA
jgi:hypothetical protein